MEKIAPYQPKNKVRIVTAASLFDGHDAAINIMRRIMQSSGAEIIHLGHNRSVQEIVNTAIQEDVQGIAITSYQGGHNEFFKYMYDLLREKGAAHIKIFGGGGGTILPSEIKDLHDYGVDRIYSPDDGRTMGLQGMINDVLKNCDFPIGDQLNGELKKYTSQDDHSIARMITAAENFPEANAHWLKDIQKEIAKKNIPVLGITGTGGSGKSSLVDELVRRFLLDFTNKTIAIISVDPSKRKTGGALLGDRIRMNAIHGGDFADMIAINKFDKRGSLDALRDVKKQYMRNHQLWEVKQEDLPVFGTIASQFNDPGMNTLYRNLMNKIVEKTSANLHSDFASTNEMSEKIFIIPPKRTRYLSEISESNRQYDRWVNAQCNLASKLYGLQQSIDILKKKDQGDENNILITGLEKAYEDASLDLDGRCRRILDEWADKKAAYAADEFMYKVRGREIRVPTFTTSLSHSRIPRIALPRYKDWGEILRYCLQENVPGEFPFTAGVFPFKRKGEDPTRMFAGEGGPERTNRRFHYLSADMPANRLSTAFDSVTLYGEDPDHRPDIYGKIGNSGVSICCLDDAKKLYSGFDLCDPKTSVSMTINGPAATICAFFMNAAIDQQCEMYIKENGLENLVEAKLKAVYDDQKQPRPVYHGEVPKNNNGLGLMLLGITGDQILEPEIYAPLRAKALASVRGTVQADILKEDQAQNTCIFSTEFSLKLMGDVQESFIKNKVRNFYSVSISGYHIAEAGANPITQLAFTLSNGFTFVEYYLSRGMDINDFAPNLSFFFSNGIDPEYAVIGRVARRIWAKAMREKYQANDRSQKLKYHIQTSGRSLHAQEISFNDIRTTLQALYAIYDNCNSLHTNAYDEAITTPTEESVRRAVAIQMIINHELGLAKNENPIQGAYIIEELTDLVEEAVLLEFDRLTERGGVLGAMETMYQRGKIQDESMHYEMLKHTGEFPIIGVNTYLSKNGSPTVIPEEVIRATEEEKQDQIRTLEQLHTNKASVAAETLKRLQEKSIKNENIFEELLEAVKVCSLGQITNALYEVGGQYRRNM